uniref:Uncharacterized protein n=1 Tax=Anguilla anguilla TaxID=7936 RepID=A0A0E9X430_ANGAN
MLKDQFIACANGNDPFSYVICACVPPSNCPAWNSVKSVIFSEPSFPSLSKTSQLRLQD